MHNCKALKIRPQILYFCCIFLQCPDTEKFSKYLLINQVSVFCTISQNWKRGIQNRKGRIIFLYFYSFTYLEHSIEDTGRKTTAQSHWQYPLCNLRYTYRYPCPRVALESSGLKADENIPRWKDCLTAIRFISLPCPLYFAQEGDADQKRKENSRSAW